LPFKIDFRVTEVPFVIQNIEDVDRLALALEEM
jgi:hypothetical protein